jgi:hypothetical protein
VIALLIAVLAAQGEAAAWIVRPALPTVGDTIRLERLVPAPPGVLGRARALQGSELVEALRAPEIVPADGGLVVRYTLALFAPGRHALPMPALELVYPDGTVELVLGDTAEVEVASVIPDSVARPLPRPSLAPIPRVPRRPAVGVGLLAGVSAALVLWSALRRRAGRPAEAARVGAAAAPPRPLPLMHWLALGERRAVASLAADRVRRRLEAVAPAAGRGLGLEECLAAAAQERPALPLQELEAVLTALDRARFAPLTADDAAELVDRTDVLLEQLNGAGTEAAS